MPLLELDRVEAGYGAIRALFGVGLALEAGRTLALIGANGAGKSTLLRAIAGLTPPSAGRVRFDGADLTGMPAHAIAARGIALVPEGRRLFASLTVEENLLMGTSPAAPGPGTCRPSTRCSRTWWPGGSLARPCFRASSSRWWASAVR